MNTSLRLWTLLVSLGFFSLSACQQAQAPPNTNNANNSSEQASSEPPPVSESTSSGTQGNRALIPPGYVFQPNIPHDLVTQNLGAIGNQPFVDNMAWQSFIALNWPAPETITERGVPDRQNVIGGYVQVGEGGPIISPTGPTVWETYKNTFDIYLKNSATPSSFDTAPSIPTACGDQNATNVLYETLQAFTGKPLIDQNGEKVWYGVNVNRVYFDYVVDNKYYDKKNQEGATIDFPESSNTTYDLATVKVKAAWKVMGGSGTKQPDDKSRFYTNDALLYDPIANTCRKATMGLVGLHIVIKTKTLPQWMWATFEHVDNAPDKDSGAQPGVQYNFYNPECKDCPVNQPPAKDDSTTPTQVMRVVPVSSVAPNPAFQAALKALRDDNVWQYYELVDAQWGASAKPLGVPNQPKYLANTTIETYLQDPVVDPGSPHGCINCHGKFAGTKDLDFQLFRASEPQSEFVKNFLSMRSTALSEEKP